MGTSTGIQWADMTWNPWYGCTKVSAGCKFCYMYRDMNRWGKDPAVVVRGVDGSFWAPVKWRKRARTMLPEAKVRWLESGKEKNWLEPGDRIFVCRWSDFFISEGDKW